MNASAARPARNGPHRRRHRDARPGGPELLVRAPLEGRDRRPGSTTRLRRRPRPSPRPASSAGGTRCARRRPRAVRVHAVDRPRQLVVLRLRQRAGQAALRRSRPGRRATTRRSSTTTAAPSCPRRSRTRAAAGRRRPATRTRRRCSRRGRRRRTARDGPACGRSSGSTSHGSTSARTRARTIPPGYCNEPANRNGSPSIVPADPNEYPGGPAAYDDLPRPQLGCSAIDLTLHGETAGNCPPGQNYGYPYPSGKRLVVAGDRERGELRRAAARRTSGYFDCALATPCPRRRSAAASGRPACVKATDSRIGPDSRESDGYHGACEAAGATGLVFRDGVLARRRLRGARCRGPRLRHAGTAGPWTSTGCCDVHASRGAIPRDVVVEGDGRGAAARSRDLVHCSGRADLDPADPSTAIPWPISSSTRSSCGRRAGADREPARRPRRRCADMGGAPGTEVHGIVYSGGNVEFNPVVVDGGRRGLRDPDPGRLGALQLQPDLRQRRPAPGFPDGSGNTVVLVRKSFIVCADYAADTAGGTALPVGPILGCWCGRFPKRSDNISESEPPCV